MIYYFWKNWPEKQFHRHIMSVRFMIERIIKRFYCYALWLVDAARKSNGFRSSINYLLPFIRQRNCLETVDVNVFLSVSLPECARQVFSNEIHLGMHLPQKAVKFPARLLQAILHANRMFTIPEDPGFLANFFFFFWPQCNKIVLCSAYTREPSFSNGRRNHICTPLYRKMHFGAIWN